MTKRDPLMHLLADLDPPSPPPDLRDRVLTAMRRSGPRETEIDLWTRLWSSRTLRLAWVATVAGLLAGHIVLFVHRQSAVPTTSPAYVMAGALQDRDLAELADLQVIAVDLLPRLDSATIGPHQDLEGRSDNGI